MHFFYVDAKFFQVFSPPFLFFKPLMQNRIFPKELAEWVGESNPCFDSLSKLLRRTS